MDAAEIQVEVRRLLGLLPVGAAIAIPGRGGWELVVEGVNVGGELDFTHRNPVPEGGGFRFFEYTTRGDRYGAGKIRQEPTLGIPLRNCGVDLDGVLVGAVVVGEDGKVAPDETGKPKRWSWSNLVYGQKKKVEVTADGELTIDGQSQGFLEAVVLVDKNRMVGWVGRFVSQRPTAIRILEMEDILPKL